MMRSSNRWLVPVIVQAAFAVSFQIEPLPTSGTVAQCSKLGLSWPEVEPPIHLHVQAGRFINYTNLRDLGIQTGNSMTWTVDLPIDAPAFSFAFYTLKNQYLVFQSDGVLQVVPGDSTCTIVQPSPDSVPFSTQSPSTKPTQSSTSSSSNSTSGVTATLPNQNSNQVPVGIIVGAALGGIVLFAILLSLLYLCYRHEALLRRHALAVELADPPPAKIVQTHNPNQSTSFLLDTNLYQIEPLPYAPPNLEVDNTRNTIREAKISALRGSHTSLPSIHAPTTSPELGSSSQASASRTNILSSGQSPPGRVKYARRASPSTDEPPVVVHTDGGVRLLAEEIPPLYGSYNESR